MKAKDAAVLHSCNTCEKHLKLGRLVRLSQLLNPVKA